MDHSLDKKRITLFCLLAFGISWSVAFIIFQTGGLVESPVIIPELGFTLAYILMATAYMFAPGLANILTRLITKEGWSSLWLKPKLKGSSRYWLVAWVLPGILTVLGAVAFFLIFPRLFNGDLSILQSQIDASYEAAGVNPDLTLSPWLLFIIQAIQAIILAPILNSISTFGEEFGWRAYLMPKLLPLGSKKAVLLSGLIWGVWHWPLILMGYNFGTAYPGAPWLGLLGMVWISVGLGIIFSWLTLRSKSIWPAVIAHGGVNGIAAIGSLALREQANPLLGPTPVGIIGGLFFAVVALNLLFHPTALQVPESNRFEGESPL